MEFLLGGIGFAIIAAVALVVTVRSPREADARSQLVAGASVFWAVITVLFFAPGGLLAALIIFDDNPISGIAILAVALDGFAIGVALFIASRRLLGGRKLGRVDAIANWSIAHHIAVVVVFTVGWEDLEVGAFTAVPCLIGLALAWGMKRRAKREAAR